MGSVSLGEVVLLARTLLTVPEAEWPVMAARILHDVRLAAVHLQTTGRPHPLLGDGSLMSYCLRLDPSPEPFCDPRVLRSLQAAARAILEHSIP